MTGLFPRQRLRSGSRSREPAFATTSQGRPLRVVVDTETVEPCLPVDLLIEFGARPSVELLTTTPIEGLLNLRFAGRNEERDYFEIEYERHDGEVRTGIWGASNWQRHAREEAAEYGSYEEAVLAAFMLLRASEVIDADALVTSRADVLSDSWKNLRRNAGLVSPEQAFALVGLHLRSRGDYTWTHRTPSWSERIPLHRYYLVATRQLVPASWRWAHATSDHFGATGAPAPVALAEATLDRFARVLRIRDLLLVDYQRGASAETAFEVRRHFDALLFTLSGAFDASARVAHHAYGLGSRVRSASWRNECWVKQLGSAQLANLCAPERPGRDVLDLLAELRNTVHGEALADSGFVDYGGPTVISLAISNPVLLPPDVAASIEPVLERLGGAEAWGVRLREPAHIDAGCFGERLLPRAAKTLNDLLAATDVTRLAGVNAADLAAIGPPPSVPAHSEDERERWFAILGVSRLA